MKKIIGTVFVFALSLSGLYAAKNSTVTYTVKGNANDAYITMMDQPIKALGYRIPDPRKGVNEVYQQQYGGTTLDVLNFMTIVNDKGIAPLLEIDPRLAGFNPFNLVAYKHMNKDETVIAHLTPETMIEMLGITDEKVIAEHKKLMDGLDDLVKKTFPDAVIGHDTYEGKVEDAMMHYEMEFERPEDLDDIIDEAQGKIEDTFTKKGYIMAGFFDYTMSNAKLLPSYDAFWTFSLCHFPFSYSVFDNENAMPQAAVFAPCTMYMYIKKGTNKIVMGMPRLKNWQKFFPMNSKKRLEFLEKLDKDMMVTFEEIGFKKIQ